MITLLVQTINLRIYAIYIKYICAIKWAKAWSLVEERW